MFRYAPLGLLVLLGGSMILKLSRSGVFLLVLSTLLSLSPADAQYIPPRPPNADLFYISNTFNIPVLWGVSDGTAKKTSADCAELQKKLLAENGRGVVTDAVDDFKDQLNFQCSLLENDYPHYSHFKVNPETGLWCKYDVYTKCEPASYPGGVATQKWCEFWISSIEVKNKNQVTVTFDVPVLPCNCVGHETLIDCGYDAAEHDHWTGFEYIGVQ